MMKIRHKAIQTVKTQLENCNLLAAINFVGFTVKESQELRRSLPQSTKLVVAKNTLVDKAIEGTKWEALKPCIKGKNAWLFVHDEDISGAIKSYGNFLKGMKLEHNDFTCAYFEGKLYGPVDFKQLETLPSEAETYAEILGTLHIPLIGLVSTLQPPASNVIMTLKP